MSRKLTKKIKQLLHNIYFNQDSKEGAYSSLINVLRVARRTIPDLSKSVVRDYLNSIDSYSLHKKAKTTFERRSFLAIAPFETLSIDLFFLSAQKKQGRPNAGLLAIDSFSKYIYAKKLKNKSADCVLEAFKSIIDRLPKLPRNIFCDKVNHGVFQSSYILVWLNNIFINHSLQGSEFYNNKFKSYCVKKGIRIYSSTSDKKAFLASSQWLSYFRCKPVYILLRNSIIQQAENGIKSLKLYIGRQLSSRGDSDWPKILDSCLSIYNSTHTPR